MCPGSDKPALRVYPGSSWPASKPGCPSCSCLKSSVAPIHAPVTVLCFFLLFALRDSVQLMLQPPSSPATAPLSHSLEGAFPHPAARAARPLWPHAWLTTSWNVAIRSPPPLSPHPQSVAANTVVPCHPRKGGAGMCCPPLSGPTVSTQDGPVGVLFIQSHPGTRDLWRRAQSAWKIMLKPMNSH